MDFQQITYLGFPLSLSETFQQRNTNKSIAQALAEVTQIQQLCVKKNKQLVVYLSMGFGNPYGDDYNPVIAAELTQKLAALGIGIIAPSDTSDVPHRNQFICYLLYSCKHFRK
jgi:hydroxymethylglutaryl-CoA lyase